MQLLKRSRKVPFLFGWGHCKGGRGGGSLREVHSKEYTCHPPKKDKHPPAIQHKIQLPKWWSNWGDMPNLGVLALFAWGGRGFCIRTTISSCWVYNWVFKPRIGQRSIRYTGLGARVCNKKLLSSSKQDELRSSDGHSGPLLEVHDKQRKREEEAPMAKQG